MIVDVENLITSFSAALVKASDDLHQTFQDHPDVLFEYTIPEMRITVNLALSYNKGKVKGWMNKSKSNSSREVASTIELELRKIPRSVQTPSS